ncbi:phage tail spike protein [Staphylococcus chromogenes]|uniref:phage tail spike protein n=1 Tax=Staphylococcus chromogenes TaxID=46126 RepID=UPI002886E890|nr:phage tail spike protein [Staphylococcus chromogenes]MDT0750755.1 phage tail spike protein [Staphylococcus chromogenes]
MIHVLNHNSEIIDFISRSDNVVIHSEYKREKENNSELLDLTILSSRAKHFKENNRIIIQDKSNQYREFIIQHIEDSGQYIDVEATASYVVDIGTAKPIPAGKYEKMSVTQKLDEVLRDTDWVTGDCDYGGVRTNSWTSVRTPYEMISQLETSHALESDFEIIIEGNEVVERRVNMRKPNSLFKGKEIEYGKDLTEMKRTVDFSELVTALFAFGPEDDKGNRISLVVTDDEAQEQFGLPTRYIWGIYEPESDDENMTTDRLKTLARTELNKRKSATVSYEISTFDIEKQFPHEVIRFGDKVRIKNSDFVPSLYAESEVIGFTHDLISDDIVYTFGNVVEYAEDDLLKYFKGKLNEINQKLNDNFTNINTIVNDAVAGELEYYERKIFKGVEPPENPVNDMLWLDTSNPDVAVLRRYWEGQWINATAEKAEDIGAITREKALYSELTNTFVNLSIQHSKLLNEMHEVMNSEYLVDFDLKDELNAKLDATVSIYNNIKSNLDSMTDETATIGKLIDTQTLFLNYRTAMQSLYNVVERAKIAIDERFKLLQSQFTDEKYNEAMEKVATAINGTWNAETGQLIADVPNEARLTELRQQIESTYDQELNSAMATLRNETDSKLVNTKNEISATVAKVDEKITGLTIGGRNLFQSYNSNFPTSINKDIVSTQSFTGRYWAVNLYRPDFLKTVLKAGETYTYSYEIEIIGLSEKEVPAVKKHGVIFYSATNTKDNILSYVDLEREVGNKYKVSKTFVAPEITDHRFIAYSGFYSDDGTIQYPTSSNLVKISNLKLEKGNKATDWTPAPEDMTNALEPITVKTTNNEQSIKALEEQILLTATKEEVTQQLNTELQPIKTDVNDQKAQLSVMSDEISTKVSMNQYSRDLTSIVEELSSAETERTQLSNKISDRVTITEYNAGMEEKTNEINTAVDNIKIGGVNMLDGTKDFTSPFNTPNIQKYGEVINGELTSVDYDSVNNRLMWATFYTNIPVQPNTDYTISYDAKTKDGIAQGVVYTPIARLQDDGTDFNPRQYFATAQTYKNTTNEFQRYSFTFNTGANKRIRLTFTSKDVNSLTNIKKVKLEIGNKATPYEQSPNDISNAITKARSDAEVSAKAYADAQDALRKTEIQAYADGIVDAEEQRAINDAQQKLAEAKADAQAKADTAESLAKQHANTQSTLAEQSAKAYADGLKQQTDQTLTTYDSRITQNGREIIQRATKEEFNKTRSTLDKTLAQIITSHSGISLTYDENGHTSDIIVDPKGIALNSKLIKINQGDVVIENGVTTIKDAYIDKLFSNQATINKLNSIDIEARRIRARDNQASVNVEGGTITMNRTDGAKLDIGLDGIAMYNSGGSKRFSMDRLLVESAALGTSNSNVYLAASDGFEARVVDRAMVPSDGSISSYKYLPIRSLALKFPQNSNGYVGVDGEFRIMSEGLVNGVYRDLRANGIFANRLIPNDATNLYLGTDSNVRLVAKGDDNVYRDLVANGVYADFVQINPNTSSNNLYLRASGEVRMTALGSTTAYQNVRANGFLGTSLDVAGNTNASNMYVRPAPGGALCVTQRNTTDTFLAVKASQGIWTSSEKYKDNIDEWNENVLQIIKETKLYEYDLISEKNTPNQRRHHGVIIERQTPKEWVVEDGVDQYEMTTWSLKAIQELLVNIELMDNRIKKMEALQNERTS